MEGLPRAAMDALHCSAHTAQTITYPPESSLALSHALNTDSQEDRTLC
jgi:hypothetical protein